METSTMAPDQLFDYDVFDSSGTKIGSVDHVWVDDSTEKLEFISVKTGWLFGKTHLIPTAKSEIREHSISVPYPESQIKEAPSFAADQELSPTDESAVYSHYGDQRPVDESPSGMTGADSVGSGRTNVGETMAGADRERVTSGNGEDANQSIDAGRVRLRKVVYTQHRDAPIELEREEVSVERVPASDTGVPTNALDQQEHEVEVK